VGGWEAGEAQSQRPMHAHASTRDAAHAAARVATARSDAGLLDGLVQPHRPSHTHADADGGQHAHAQRPTQRHVVHVVAGSLGAGGVNLAAARGRTKLTLHTHVPTHPWRALTVVALSTALI
jgi:hypothetical protein